MFVKVNGANLYYDELGEGNIPCIVASAAGVLHMQRTIEPAIHMHFKSYWLELRGSGRSDLGPGVKQEDITLDMAYADIDKFRQALGLGKVAVLGISMYGMIATGFAGNYPESVSHVIALATVPGSLVNMRQETEKYFQSFADAERKAVFQKDHQGLTPEDIAKLSPPEQYHLNRALTFHNPTYDIRWVFEGNAMTPGFLHYAKLLTEGYHPSPLFPRIKGPVLVASGRYDFLCPHYLWEKVVARYPNFTFKLFERSGHHPELEEKELFIETLDKWLKANQ